MSEPNNNVESLLTAILKNDSSYLVVPQSRVEELLLAIYKNGGGGGGGSDITRYEVEQMLLGKVDTKPNYSLISNSEIERLAGVDNYDDKSIRNELGQKVEKKNGYSLILNADYDNFKKLENYDDSELRTLINDISNDLGSRVPNDRTIAGKKLDKNISVDDLLKALNLDKVNNTSDTDKPISTATQTALDQKVDETELLSFKEEMYEQTGGKSLWSLDKKTIKTGAFLYNGSLVLQPGKYKLCFKSNKTSVALLTLLKDSTAIVNITLNHKAGLNEFPFELTSESDTMSIWANAVDTYTELAIIRDGIPAEPYIPVTPTNSELNTELKTNLLSTIVASSNASATNAKVLDFQGTGKAVEKLVVEGKTVQDGTPSPSAPVEVKGVGDGGWNIIPFAKKETKSLNGVTIASDGLGTYTLNGTATADTFITFNIDEFVTPKSISNNGKGCLYLFNNKTFAASSAIALDFMYKSQKVDGWSFTFLNRASYDYNVLGEKQVDAIRFHIYPNTTTNFLCKPMMTNDGKTDHEFVSYGKYKIQISSGGKSTNIYLNAPLFDGEIADITSGIVNKKYGMYVLTGNETFTTTSIDSNLVQYAMDKPSDIAATSGYGQPVAICSIATRQTSATFTANIVGFGNKMGFVVNKSEFANDTAFKERLTALYNAGTPAVVVYQLATPTKETFDAPEIPTAVGKNTLTVGTDVTPAKVEVTSFGEYYSKAEVDKMIAERDAKINSNVDYVHDANIINPMNVGDVRNLISFTASSSTMCDGSVTVTRNSDGTITLNGTATKDDSFILGINLEVGKTYWFGGMPEKDIAGLSGRAYDTTKWEWSGFNRTGLVITAKYTSYQYRIYVASGTKLNNVVVTPIVQFSDIIDRSFVKHEDTVLNKIKALESRVAALEGK